jgi:hypothetical protein
MDVGLPVGPGFFLFSDPEHSQRALRSAGFVPAAVTHVPLVWRVCAPEEVFETVLQGSVRAAATLRAQTPQAREAIKSELSKTIGAYRRAARYEVPMPAVLAAGVKPSA